VRRTAKAVTSRLVCALVLPQQLQAPSTVGHYAGGASGKTAGHTALAGHLFRFLFSGVPQWLQIAGVIIGVPVAIIVIWQLLKRRRRVWGWWLARGPAMKLALIAAVFVVVAGASVSGLAGYTYMMHNNDFCQSCHIMDTAWNRFQVSAHKNIQCHACHRQPLYVSTVELYYWVTQRMMQIPEHDKVPSTVCDECHLQKGADSTLTQVMLTAGHAVHLRSDSSALKNVQCVTCHGRDFHIFIPNNPTCTQSGCHVNTRVNLGAMSRQAFPHCTICHDFKSRVPLSVTVAQAKTRLTPQVMNCFGCHQMIQQTKRFDLNLDPHKGNCGICHNPHKQEKPNDAFKTCAESKCHGSPDTLTSFHRGLGGHKLAQCGSCHTAHSWRVKGTNCISCHQSINRDPPQRSSSLDESSIVRALMFATSSSRSFRRTLSPLRRAPAIAHLTALRSTAMTPARPRAASSVPSVPHPVVADSFRHSLHKSLACTTCHGTTTTHGGLKFTAPGGCVACHHSTRQRVECTGCHDRASLPDREMPMAFAISARPETITRPESFTHERHAGLACTRCHGDDVKRSVATTCKSCHAEHHTTAADCAGCHPTARTGHDRASHDGCARCHTDAVVAALPASRSVCLACHEKQRDHYPNGDCATCHATPHDMMRVGRVGAGR
jgi:nitrate/TMAO reductase-like tetraheme cytochrome c subunit